MCPSLSPSSSRLLLLLLPDSESLRRLRLQGERRQREPHAADRRGESTQAPADEADPGGVDSSPPPERTGGSRYPVITLISTTHEPRWPRGNGGRLGRLLTGLPSEALAIPRRGAGQMEYWRLFTPLPRVTPSDADGGTSRRARTCAFSLRHFVDIKTHNAPRLRSVSVRIRSVGGSSSASRGRQQMTLGRRYTCGSARALADSCALLLRNSLDVMIRVSRCVCHPSSSSADLHHHRGCKVTGNGVGGGGGGRW